MPEDKVCAVCNGILRWWEPKGYASVMGLDGFYAHVREPGYRYPADVGKFYITGHKAVAK